MDRSWTADTYGPRAHGNYAVDWGYCDFTQTQPSGYKLGPFRWNNITEVADIRDGLSNTIFLGEVIQSPKDEDYDFRGDIFNDDIGGAQFMSYSTPNSGVDALEFCGTTATDEVMPCTTSATVHYVASRSKHPGGVNVAFGDGSVTFIGNSISITAWRALTSMAGDETVSGNAF